MERIDGVGRDQQADARTACVDLGSGFLSQRANAMRDGVKNGVFMGCPSQHRHIYKIDRMYIFILRVRSPSC
jgi:hypothetical protein